MPPSFKLRSISNASSQTFDQTAQKNSDIPATAAVIVNPYRQPMRYSTHSHTAKPPPSLSRLIRVDQDPRFGSVRRSAPVLLRPQSPPKVRNVVTDADAFAGSIKTILRDAVREVLQEEVERRLAPCLLEIESRLIDLSSLGETRKVAKKKLLRNMPNHPKRQYEKRAFGK